MTRKEAAIRYALENGELDGLKVWLLNGGDIEEYFVKNKKNINLSNSVHPALLRTLIESLKESLG